MINRILPLIALFLFVITPALPVLAQSNQSGSKPLPVTASPVADRSKPDAAEASAEIQVLKAQLQTMKDYDDRILATVYWALGGIAGLAVVLCGYSWYNNNLLFEREKELTRKELRILLQEDFKVALDSANEETNDKSRVLLSDFENEINVRLDDKIDDINTKIEKVAEKLEIDGLRTSSRMYAVTSAQSSIRGDYLIAIIGRLSEIKLLKHMLRFSSASKKAERLIAAALAEILRNLSNIKPDPQTIAGLKYALNQSPELFAELPAENQELINRILDAIEDITELGEEKTENEVTHLSLSGDDSTGTGSESI